MTSRWRPFRLLAPPTLLIVAAVLVAAWLSYRAGQAAATGRGTPSSVPIILSVTLGMVVLATAWLAYRLNRRWVRPVQRISDAVDAMAAGRWEARAELPETEGAVNEFANQVNAFVESVQTHVAALNEQREDLVSLVDAMPDPVLLTDSQRRVMLINLPATRFLSVSARQALGQKLVSVLGEASLVEIYESLAQFDGQAGAVTREIRVTRDGQKYIYQAVAACTRPGGVLLVLRDVTRLAQTVQMKTDFVANASHELRTPIAAIKIAFETLSDVYTDDPEQTARCISIIGGHMRRLEAMLQDLLDLSRVENAELKPEWADLPAAEVLTDVRSAMGPLARNKGLDLTFDSGPRLVFRSDRKLLDLILKNLVENAIKYTPEGGRIGVSLHREQEADAPSQVVLRVTDTGIGIPPQHLDRVFERFYQVDSARSGSSGRGTGLGLAIVKHAALALGAHVELDSTVGRGTTVSCAFPEPAHGTAVLSPV